MSSPIFYEKPIAYAKKLMEHLRFWGLRRFSDEANYYQWQKEVLNDEEIADLNRLASGRKGGEVPDADIAFYDRAAHSNNLAVLYSQRYDYYLKIGCAVTDRIEPAHRVLDLGCGVGILTTFYALCFPGIRFVGLDRSSGSIARARDEAAKRGILNVQFEHSHIPSDDLCGSFDLIISTQSLFQAERDPGLPSLNWKTFERGDSSTLQVEAEIRTGLKDRLDWLSKMLLPEGRILLCEKAWHLGRRILLQRALASRRYQLIAAPLFFRYRVIDEEIQDGPLFEISKNPKTAVYSWYEGATIEPGESLYAYQGRIVEEFVSIMADAEFTRTVSFGGSHQERSTVTFARWGQCLAYGYVQRPSGFRGILIGSLKDEKVIQQYFLGAEKWTDEEQNQAVATLWPDFTGQDEESEVPIYENHTAAAQVIWASLPDRHLKEQATFREHDGREVHIEWGTCGLLTFLYRANTYDQRQLVLMTPHQGQVLQAYYREALTEMKRGSQEGNQT